MKATVSLATLGGMVGLSILGIQGCSGASFTNVDPSSTPQSGDNEADAGDASTLAPDAASATTNTNEAAPPNPPPVAPPSGCDPKAEPRDSVACVSDAFGVFVSAQTGADTNRGTRASPMKTIVAALGKAASAALPRVYVCEGDYPEPLTLDAQHDGISIYGGWSCGGWDYSGVRPQLIAKGAGPTLTVASAIRPIVVADVDIASKNAAAAGESSVAIVATGSSILTFRRAKIRAGAGGAGVAGAAGNTTLPPARPGHNAMQGTVKIPFGGTVTCADGMSQGGGGGQVEVGAFEAAEAADGSPTLGAGLAGASAAGGCTIGGNGANGVAGVSGVGAASMGTLSATGIWTPTGGASAGKSGSLAQGGGGGGWRTTHGGGGGSGGCGGAGGAAGTGAGASIGIISIGATISLTACELITAPGVPGGAGGAGQTGGIGAGSAATQSCAGGVGGTGGSGGSGGGGAGGLAVGILHRGSAPTLDDATRSKAQIGAAGPGGGPAATPSKGADGKSGTTLAID